MVFWESQLSIFWFEPVWGLCASGQHAVNFFHLARGLVSAKQLKDMTRILSIALEEELKVPDFVLWLNYYYFVLFDCFSLFLSFLTFLIKFVLWNSGDA